MSITQVIHGETARENTVLKTSLPDGRVLSTILKSGGVMGRVGETRMFRRGDSVSMPDCYSANEHHVMASVLCA